MANCIIFQITVVCDWESSRPLLCSKLITTFQDVLTDVKSGILLFFKLCTNRYSFGHSNAPLFHHHSLRGCRTVTWQSWRSKKNCGSFESPKPYLLVHNLKNSRIPLLMSVRTSWKVLIYYIGGILMILNRPPL